MKSRIRGDVGFSRLLRHLPETVREEMGDVLDVYGDKLLSAMRADVPVDTGELKSRLSKKLFRKTLKLRVGFIGKRANGASRSVTRATNRGRKRINDQFVGKQFYGRFVEFGRKAQTVRVTRKAKVLRITGNNRSEANRREHTYGPGVYMMQVKAMAARPFVFKKRPELRRDLSSSLRTMWDNALAQAGQGVSFGD